MAALDFPASSASPWTAPNGVIYTWNTDGYWEAKADPANFDNIYLSKVNDDTAAGEITFEELSTHEGGVKVTGGTTAAVDNGILSDANGTRIIHNGLGVLAGNNGLLHTAVSLAGSTAGGSNNTKDGVRVQSTFAGTTNSASGITSNCDISNFACTSYQFYSAGTTFGTPDPGKAFGTSTVYSAFLSTAVGRSKAYGFYTDYPENGAVNYGFYAAGTAPNYFKGYTTLESGFEASGPGSYMTATNFVCTSELASFRGASTAADAFAVNAGLYQKGNVTDGAALRITAGTSNGFARTSYKGIDIVDFKTNAAGETRIGVYSALTTSPDGDNFNFYAGGGARNYFAGETTMKGGATRGGAYIKATAWNADVPRFDIFRNDAADSTQALRIGHGSITSYSIRYNGTASVSLPLIRVSTASITNAVETIKAFTPTAAGFSGQDFIDNLPDAVDMDSLTAETVMVEKDKLIPLLTKALQEALERIEALENA